jgi:hypothetical protein
MLRSYLSREMRLHEADKDTGNPAQDADPTPPEAEQAPANDFDKDRAMATIKQLRQFEKDAKAKLKRLEELEKADSDRRQAEMTEADRLKAELETIKAQHDAANQELTRRRVLDAARREAEKKALAFYPDALEDELKLGSFDSATVKDDGTITGLGEILTDLAKRKPYLLKPAAKAGDIDAGARGGTNDKKEASARLERNARSWGITLRND